MTEGVRNPSDLNLVGTGKDQRVENLCQKFENLKSSNRKSGLSSKPSEKYAFLRTRTMRDVTTQKHRRRFAIPEFVRTLSFNENSFDFNAKTETTHQIALQQA